MANRHLSRSIVLQTLFEWDVAKERGENAPDVDTTLARNVEEFAKGSGDHSYMERLLHGVLQKQDDLDLIIGKAAPEWPLSRIAPIDRNILRIGLYELLFADRFEVPAKVAINEAIELGKRFGGESSGRFVNGVLGAIYREIGEPGKDETSKRKKKEPVPYDKLPVEKKVGAVVFARDGANIYVALVHDVFGHWTLPKGTIEVGEDEVAAAVREIKEEVGLAITIREKLGENEYIATTPDEGKKRKHVVYFLGESEFSEIKLEEKGGLDDARWFKLADILDLNFYHDILPIITKAINILLRKE